MKICIAQTEAAKGQVNQNISNHLQCIEYAVAEGADLIFFPELSLTGYEPTLANTLAIDTDDALLLPFQETVDTKKIVIAVGMPTTSAEGPLISMLFFQPKKKRTVYSKRRLHDDELPYFVAGNDEPLLHIGNKKIALGICYETLQQEHFEVAASYQADLFLASVAKQDRGLKKAYVHFPTMAATFGFPILMANCIGFCDNFVSNGQSAVWNAHGQLLGQLDTAHQGLLMYDTISQEVQSMHFKTGVDSLLSKE